MDIAAEFNRGCGLFGSGRFLEAEAAFRTCLKAHPGHPDLLNALGSALDACGKWEEAAGYLKEACRVRPDFAPYRYNYANILRRGDRRQEAEREYLEAVRLNPGLAEAYHGLGTLFKENGDAESAEACLEKAVALAPELAPALHDLGQLRQSQGRNHEAERLYRKALAVDGRYPPALNSLGMLLLRANDVDAARKCFEAALAADPHYLQARCNLGVLATWGGDLAAAIAELRQVTAAAPADADTHFNLALALLAAGEMAEGWREYEWRFRKSNPVPLRHPGIPLWQNEPLSGKTIMLCAEQGYGDSLQFVRYARMLADRGATVVVEGQDERITSLLSSAPGVHHVICRNEDPPHVDLQIPMMSLPLRLGEQSWPPPSPPYLFAQPGKSRYWKERLGSLSGLKVGIAWAGRPEHENDANRSLPPDAILPLALVKEVSLVSLQFGPGVAGQPALHDFSADIRDFTDSAALVAGLDLVITVDSAVAHLAGALGVRTWLLLPWNPDWRWMRDRRDTLWYQRTKIYRQGSPGRWSDVIAEVAADLAAEAAKEANERTRPHRADGPESDDTAWAAACRAVAASPGSIVTWRALVHAAMTSAPSTERRLPEEPFLAAVTPDSNNLDELAVIGLFFLRRDPRLAQFLQLADESTAIGDLLATGKLDFLLLSRPLQRLCELTILCDPEMERLLTSIRRTLLSRRDNRTMGDRIDGEYLPFVCALATLCFNNEYIFFETQEETLSWRQLLHDAESGRLNPEHRPGLVALLGAYHPLHLLKHAPAAPEGAKYPSESPLGRMLNLQVREPLEEQRLAAEIPKLTAIEDSVSQAVRRQYEENPYPRWVGIRLPAPRPLAEILQNISPGIELDPSLNGASPSILVAGCGTGQHPLLTAARFAGSTVLAVDLSLASLAYARRKALETGAESIRFGQADILALGSMTDRFDVIECGGVLHHLRDPVEGWQILLRLLKPGGVMGIGLYSRLARRWINRAKQILTESGRQSDGSSDTIRKLRHELWDSFPPAVSGLRDFFTVSGCRDLLFHVQEHQFDLEQVASILRELNLEFLGFQLSPAVTGSFRSRFTEEASLTDLARWKEFEEENPDTFANMYQFYVRKPAG